MKNRVHATLLCRASAAALLACAGSGALAQTAGSGRPEKPPASTSVVEEIVVTATRQPQELSRVPLSVAAYDQKAMDAQGVRNVGDISRITPNLYLTPPGSAPNDVTGGRTTIAIRGIYSVVGAPTTGIYIDDTPIQTRPTSNIASTAYPRLFDLQRVEVLRGPQGTLFGAGAQGGVLRFITPQPSLDTVQTYGRLEAGATKDGAPSYEAGLAVGGPILADKLGFRASGWYGKTGGWVDRVDPRTGARVEKNSNSSDAYGLRGALRYEPTDNFQVGLSIFHQHEGRADPPLMFESLSSPSHGVFRSGRVLDQPLRDTFTLPSLEMEIDLGGGVRLISNTAYLDRHETYDGDYTNFVGALLYGSPLPIVSPQESRALFGETQRSFTQEVRLQSDPAARLSWVIGVFYGRSRQTSTQVNVDHTIDAALKAVYGVGVQGVFGMPLDPGDVVFQFRTDTLEKQLAGFGQVDFEVVEGLKLTAGLRVARSVLEASQSTGGPFAGGPAGFSGRQSETPVTPKFGVSYQINADQMVYASAAKGFRIGGVSAPVLSFCRAELDAIGLSGASSTYHSDSVWSYEVGSKNRLLGDRLSVDVSAFRVNWSNIQQRVPLTSCGSGFVTNFGDASSTGFELSLAARPSDRLSLSVNVGYAKTQFEETLRGIGSTVFAEKGERFGGPVWTLVGSAEYLFDALSERDGYVRGDVQYTGDGPTPNPNVVGVDPTLGILPEAFTQVSLRAGIRVDRLDLSVFADNLLDDHPISGRSRDTRTSPLYYITSPRPRTVGVTAIYRY